MIHARYSLEAVRSLGLWISRIAQRRRVKEGYRTVYWLMRTVDDEMVRRELGGGRLRKKDAVLVTSSSFLIGKVSCET